MEGYIINSVNYINGFKITNYQPDLDELQMSKAKISIIKKLHFIFSNDTKSIDT